MTNVWTSNWLLEKEARPPMYKQDSIVDLTLKVRDLWFPNTQVWNAQKVFDTFTEEDALKILTIKPAPNRKDSDVWGFTKNGIYTTLWKGRNALVFERNRITPHSTIAKALEETEIWYQLLCSDHPPHTTTASPNAPHGAWEKPPADVVKCNVGMAWEAPDHISGSSWIVRDCQGKALHHSRQALFGSSSKTESDLRSLHWAVQAMGDLRYKKILKILELLYCFEKWTIFHVSDQKNKVAKTIAESVISGSRVQSYVASGSPRWLHQMILEDARSV
ncbi:hypothetical protein F2Q68_00030625 [Brassica cretica]|uniref:RNase H type-1 domain-containing protein n=1 Tax=Brassica cretica TaxID=69181 RepID=A0A8S9GDT2_BRACR|nr:hypothetical protein F2Q68_00030625 [Brassica cretica]